MHFKNQPFPDETYHALVDYIHKGYLTRVYFNQGMHNLVVPGWINDILGPHGIGRHGFGGLPLLNNTDLRSFYILGSPNSEEEPIVDHRGGVIPKPGTYTIIFGTIYKNRPIYSSEAGNIKIEIQDDGYPIVTVYWKIDNDTMVYEVYAGRDDEGNEAMIINVVRGFANHQLLVTLTAFDQDSVTQIENIEYDSKNLTVKADDHPLIRISELPIRSTCSNLRTGHAGRIVHKAKSSSNNITSEAKVASWAALFPVRSNPTFNILLAGEECDFDFPDIDDIEEAWEDWVDELPELETSNDTINHFFVESAIVLRLLLDENKSIMNIGSASQEKEWMMAILFQTIAMDRLSFDTKIVESILDRLLSMVDNNGIFNNTKQWDIQGALVHAVANHYFITQNHDWVGEKFSTLKRIAEWVIRSKKKQENAEDIKIKNLMLPGNPSWLDPLYWDNNYYYSHNFWTASILNNIRLIGNAIGKHGEADKYRIEFDRFMQSIDDSISEMMKSFDFLPAGPYKKDSSEILFNLFSIYPLKLYTPAYKPLYKTYTHIVENYIQNGGILIDQPWNAYGSYFTLLVSQIARFFEDGDNLQETIKFMITNSTNQQGWAEGISPLTNLGSIGDSPNGFTAAMWINLILDMFIEDNWNDSSVLLKGIPREWLENGIKIDGIRTYYNGKITLEANLSDNKLTIKWDMENANYNPIVYIPYELKKLPRGVKQHSTNHYKLPNVKGDITFVLKKK